MFKWIKSQTASADSDVDSNSDTEIDSDSEETFYSFYEGQRINKTQSRGYFRISGHEHIKLWSHNREINHKRVNAIYREMLREYNEDYKDDDDITSKYFCPTVSSEINIGDYDDEKLILDGQHRWYAYTKLYAKINVDFHVPILITTVSSEEALIERFKLINQHTRVSSEKLGQTDLELVCSKLCAKYGPSMGNSKRTIFGTNRPYINKNEFVKCLRANNLHAIYTANELVVKLIEINDHLLSLEKIPSIPKKYCEKGKLVGFMLGLDKSFTYLKTI